VKKRLVSMTLFVALGISTTLAAQDPPSDMAAAATEPQAGTTVPRLVKFSGVMTDAAGKPAAGAVTASFSLYEFQEGGSPLWVETQNLQLDDQGRYTVLLGATQPEGLPLDLFTTGRARWLGVQPQLPGTGEQPRVLLVGMPYALKASDADTLGGKPASAYLLSQDQEEASGSTTGGTTLATAAGRQGQTQKAGGGDAKQSNGSSPNVSGTGVTDYIPLWTSPTALGDSILFQTSSGNVGVGTKTPGARVDADSAGIAVRGTSGGTSGTGVFGNALATSGYTNGVYGQSASTYGTGVFGNATATTGNGTGVYGQTSSPGAAGVVGVANVGGAGLAPTGVQGFSSDPGGYGVGGGASAVSGSATGVIGASASTNGTGVAGFATATSGPTYGVTGSVSSPSGGGVLGQNSANAGNGVNGISYAATGDSDGVYGQSSSSGSGAGVYGYATAPNGPTTGVFGLDASPDGTGVVGDSSASGGTGVVGLATASSGGIGIIGATDSANGTAGIFSANAGQGLILLGLSGSGATQVFSVDASGNLDISGNITVAGKKSARVKLPDGREVALYAVESPENWFEDFGTAQLKSGAAEVALEPEFLQTVDTAADYHVFLTPNGDCRGLYVARKTSSGFEVRELGGGSASVAFDYRIVAKRRGFETVRLEEVHVPQGPKDMAARLASMRTPERMAPPPARPPLPIPQPPKIMIPPVPHPDGSTH